MSQVAPSVSEGVRLAFAALLRGQATERQQFLALNWLLNDLCGVARPMWHSDNARLSDYQQGMRYVGCVIVDLARAPIPSVAPLEDEENA